MSDLYIFGYGSSGPSTIDISSATVTLGPSLTYNGSEQTQTVSSVVINGVTLIAGIDYTITDNTATNAGSYTLAIVGQGAYSGAKSVSWSIAKATGSVSVSPASLSIIGANNTATSTITVVGDGNVSVGTSASGVATASVSGSTVTVTGVGNGSATITITLGAGTNYTGDNTTISVSVMVINPTLSNNTPEQIQAAAQAGIASTLWSVGDKTAAISIGAFSSIPATTNVSAFIIGFNHNSSKEGNGIHFQFGKIGDTDVAFYSLTMNSSKTNSGGWNSSNMRATHCPAFLSALPQSWQNVIASTSKYTDNQGDYKNSNVTQTATSDKIWLLSQYEVFGSKGSAASTESSAQAQYDYYKNGNSKVKYQYYDTSLVCGWWLRSPIANYGFSFCSVYTNGTAYSNYANGYLGFAPGFRIA